MKLRWLIVQNMDGTKQPPILQFCYPDPWDLSEEWEDVEEVYTLNEEE